LIHQVITLVIGISSMKVLLTLDESSLSDVIQNGYDYTEIDDKILVELDQIKYDPNHLISNPIEQLCDYYLLNPDDILSIEDVPSN